MHITVVGHVDGENYWLLFPFTIIHYHESNNGTGWDGDRDKAVASKAVSVLGIALEVYIDMRIAKDQLHRPTGTFRKCIYRSVASVDIHLLRKRLQSWAEDAPIQTQILFEFSPKRGYILIKESLRLVFPITLYENYGSQSTMRVIHPPKTFENASCSICCGTHERCVVRRAALGGKSSPQISLNTLLSYLHGHDTTSVLWYWGDTSWVVYLWHIYT